MIVKSVAADAAVIHDVFYSDLIQRPFIQQPDKGFFDSLACKLCHGFLQPDDPYTLSYHKNVNLSLKAGLPVRKNQKFPVPDKRYGI